MADYCNQCATDHGFDPGDFNKKEILAPDYGYYELCEGCGPTIVDGFGNCIGECLNVKGVSDGR